MIPILLTVPLKMSGLTTEDVRMWSCYGYSPETAGGVGCLQSAYSVEEHVGLFIMADQTPIEPASHIMRGLY